MQQAIRTESETAVESRRELTLLGLMLGGAITLVFTAANVYLGLKLGLTFASSIPAAVISMAVLRSFKNTTIYENNIVQTVASAAGTISSVIFVLPGLVMIGWWTGFPFWESFGVCVVGGILGVMYSVPLRRALVTNSDLPYPEGVAAAEVLRVGAGTREGSTPEAIEENKRGMLAIVGGSIVSAAFAAFSATRVAASEAAGYLRIGPASATGTSFSLSLALVGAGHLIGMTVGMAMLAGVFIAWGIATPLLTSMHPLAGSAADVALTTWSHKVRFIGAGTIGICAIWTLATLARPVWGGVRSAIAASAHRANAIVALPRTERDIPIGFVALISLVTLIPLMVVLAAFMWGGALSALMVPIIAASVVYVVIAGFLVAAACGYMAGLVGSSNSPVSGLAILAVIGAALLLVLFAKSIGATAAPALVAYALLVCAVVLCVATIANDNLQDLKTGQLVDATPWRQQVALCVGVVFGSIVIPPILDLLNHAYGFVGAPNTHVVAGSQPLAAPQATLISALAKGVIEGQLDWGLIGTGVLIGLAIVATDEVLRRSSRYRLPPLAVGLGIYLPPSVTLPVVVGAVAGRYYNRWAATTRNPEATKRLGVLMASGLIVGESLFGVLLAGLIVASGKPAPLGLVGDWFQNPSMYVGAIAFILAVAGLYRWISRLSQSATSSPG